MNWYKGSQIRWYTDIGHNKPSKKNKILLWICDRYGSDFRMAEAEDNTDNHYNLFDGGDEDNFWCRHEAITNSTSISIPFNEYGVPLTPDEIPNRIIGRLMSEFPGTNIWGFDENGKVTQII